MAEGIGHSKIRGAFPRGCHALPARDGSALLCCGGPAPHPALSRRWGGEAPQPMPVMLCRSKSAAFSALRLVKAKSAWLRFRLAAKTTPAPLLLLPPQSQKTALRGPICSTRMFPPGSRFRKYITPDRKSTAFFVEGQGRQGRRARFTKVL